MFFYQSCLLLPANRSQAPAIQFEQLVGIVLWLGSRTGTGETHAARRGAPVARGHGDKFHQVECNIFVAAGCARTRGGCFFHDSFSSTGNYGDVSVVLVFLHAANDDAIHDDGWMTLTPIIAEESRRRASGEAEFFQATQGLVPLQPTQEE